MNLWKPQVATEYPFTLHIIFKARSVTESGGQQLDLTADQQDPGVVLSPRDSIWHTLSHLGFSQAVGDLTLGPQVSLENTFPMDLSG